ncbi:MAG: Ig-like domain-containing protein [Clostridia bacterium]|nr:Ig-like domain-containing protein [Clostridia bacterium]
MKAILRLLPLTLVLLMSVLFAFAEQTNALEPIDAEETRAPEATPLPEATYDIAKTLEPEVTNASSFFLSVDHEEIGVGERIPIEPIWSAESDARILWSTSNDRVAQVSSGGVVTGKHTGSATITAYAEGCEAQCVEITVLGKPSKVSLKLSADRLAVGQSATARAVFPAGKGGGISYSVSPQGVISVDSDGTIYAQAVGSAKLTVTAYNGKKAAKTVTVEQAPDGVLLPWEAIEMGEGQTIQAEASAPNGGRLGFEYAVSPSDAVAVSTSGKIEALEVGSAVLTVSSFNGYSASVPVRVIPAPQAIFVSGAPRSVGVGERVEISVDLGADYPNGYALSSAKPKVLRVEGNTLVGVKTGTARVTARSYNGLQTQFEVNVMKAPKRIRLEPASIRLTVGESQSLRAVFESKQGGGMVWTSDDTQVALVDGSGVVTALACGEAHITATAYNGISVSAAVSVSKPAAMIDAPNQWQIGLGEMIPLALRAMTEDGEVCAVEVQAQSEDEAIAQVENGRLIGNAVGKTYLKLSAGALEQTVPVSVEQYYQLHTVHAVAHRGGMGYWPENTLTAFRNSASTGADTVELDAQTTKDGVQVVNHNATISYQGKKVKIADTTLSKLKSMKSDLCTLEEALRVLKDAGLYVQLELKAGANAKTCVKLVQSLGMSEQVTYISFVQSQLEAVRKCDADARIGILYDTKVPANVLTTARKLGASVLLPKVTVLDINKIEEWHRAGLQVGTWPLETPEEIRKYILLGVDCITSNCPDLIVREMEKLKNE